MSTQDPSPSRMFREAARDMRSILSLSNLLALGGLMMLVLGVPLLGVAVWLGYRQHSILKHWLEVEALVERTEIQEYAPGRGNRAPAYRVEHDFLYRVGGEEYRATVLEPWSGTTRDIGRAKRLAQAFPTGERRRIRFNPDDPSEICHDARYTPDFYQLPGMVGAAALGLLITGGLLRRLSRQKAETLCMYCGLPVLPEQRYCPHCGRPLPIR